MKIMRTRIKIFIGALLCIVAYSCKTTQKMSINTTPGTEIYTPMLDRIAVADNSGVAHVVLPSDGYYAYLLSKPSGSDLLVPFALDYKKNKYTATKILGYAGGVISYAGFMAAIFGGVDVASTDSGEEPMFGGTPLLVGGLGMLAAGGSMLGVSLGRMSQTCNDYQFEYLGDQKANQDMTFTRPVFDVAPVKEVVTPKPENNSTQVDEAEESSTVSTSFFGSSIKSLRNYGAQVAGEYEGVAMLLYDDELLKNFEGIKLVLTRIDATHVSVEVMSGDGEKLFGSASSYGIEKMDDGSYCLVHEEVPSATITIGQDERLVYLHPRINIDGDIYALKIEAKKAVK